MYLLDYDGQARSRVELNPFDILSPHWNSVELELDYETKEILKEINDQSSDPRPYSVFHNSENWDSETELKIATAMDLADRREFGFFDELSVYLFGKVFRDFAGQDTDPWLRFKVPSVYRKEPLPWSRFNREFLKLYFIPDWEASYEGFNMEEFRFEFYAGKEKVSLQLANGGHGQVLWSARGLSKLKLTHLALVSDLNSVLKYFQRRLDLMRRLRNYPGLDEHEISLVAASLAVFYGAIDESDLDILRESKRVSDGHLDLDYGNNSAFVVRCRSCEHPAGMEIVYSDGITGYGPAARDPEATHRSVPEREVNSLLLELHRKTGCKNRSWVSSRTGEVSGESSMPMELDEDF